VNPSDGVTSRRRALGAGVGLAVVIATYGPSRLEDPARWWAAAAAVAVGVVLADVLPSVRRLLPVPGVAPATILATLAAVGLCVPETDQMAIAAIVPVGVVVAEVIGRRQLGVEWYAVAAASVLWAGMFGATGRQSALVGALFAWWAVALLPLAHAVRPVRSRGTAMVVAGIGAIAVVAVARTGGVADTAAPAWIAAAVAAVVSLGLAVVIVRAVPGTSLSARP
jgi:hypothetical protein